MGWRRRRVDVEKIKKEIQKAVAEKWVEVMMNMRKLRHISLNNKERSLRVSETQAWNERYRKLTDEKQKCECGENFQVSRTSGSWDIKLPERVFYRSNLKCVFYRQEVIFFAKSPNLQLKVTFLQSFNTIHQFYQ